MLSAKGRAKRTKAQQEEAATGAGADIVARQRAILWRIPYRPNSVTTAEISRWLQDRGIVASPRTVQRDILQLCARTPGLERIENGSSIPQYAYAPGASTIWGTVSSHEALALCTVQKLGGLLPSDVHRALAGPTADGRALMKTPRHEQKALRLRLAGALLPSCETEVCALLDEIARAGSAFEALDADGRPARLVVVRNEGRAELRLESTGPTPQSTLVLSVGRRRSSPPRQPTGG